MNARDVACKVGASETHRRQARRASRGRPKTQLVGNAPVQLILLNIAVAWVAVCVALSCRGQTSLGYVCQPLHTFDGTLGPGPLLYGSDGVLYGAAFSAPPNPAVNDSGYLGIYKLNTNGTGYNMFFTLPGSGDSLQLPLQMIEGVDGRLCVTTYTYTGYGYTFYGTVFAVNKDGSGFTLLHSFPVLPGGAGPTPGPLVQGSDGALFGAYSDTSSGFFSLTTSGAYTDIDTFAPVNFMPQSLIQATNGFLYSAGNTVSNSTASVLMADPNASGHVSVIANLGINTEAGPIVQGVDGALYGWQFWPSSYTSSVYRVTADGSSYSIIHQFLEVPTAASLVLGPNGALYGGTGYGDVFRLTTDSGNFDLLRGSSSTVNDIQLVNIIVGRDGVVYGTGLIYDTNGTSSGTVSKLIWPPTLLSWPSDQTVPIHQTATFSVTANGASPLSYQWQLNGANLSDGPRISGSSSPTLSITDVSVTDVGTYSVTVTNMFGSVSAVATLTVLSAVRTLPAGYWPNVKFVVTVEVEPPPGSFVNSLEESLLVYPDNNQLSGTNPPLIVGAISDGGSFDSANFKIKFGPFLDDSPRTLTYELTPPPGTTNFAIFQGTFSVDGTNYTVGGNSNLNVYPLHPADNNPPIDNRITRDEFSAYAQAWALGNTWPVEPNPIPISYMTRAGSLWKSGEYYVFQGSLTNAPLCWVNTNPPSGTVLTPVPLSGTATSGTAVRNMPADYAANVSLTINLTITPGTDVVAFAVEDRIPQGWTANNISNSGAFDSLNNSVKWGPFFGTTQRILTYQVTPASNANGVVTFNGAVSFDGASVPIAGIVQVASGSAKPVLALMALDSAGVVLNWNGLQGASYQLQYTTNLWSGTWMNLGSVLTGRPVMSFTNAIGLDRQRFYRVVLSN